MSKPLISVVVPTYNSADNLQRFLNSFLSSTSQDYEIIVNDDNRTDDTTAIIVMEAKQRGIPVQIIKDNQMMAQARKAGARRARGAYLFHLDSDMEITPTLLQECTEQMSVGFDALVVPEESFGTSFWARCKCLEKRCYDRVEQLEALRLVKTEVYRKLGGHDQRLVFSEDKDLDLRIRGTGYKVGRTTAHLRHNEGQLRLRTTLRKKAEYGESAYLFAQKHPAHFRWQVNILNRYVIYARNIKYLFKTPNIYLGMLFMKTCEFGAAAIAMVSKKVMK